MARALDPAAEGLLAAWRDRVLPCGEDEARRIRAISWSEKGEIRSSPRARWMPFTAAQRTEATRSAFVWDAVIGTGALRRTAVTDAYEDGRGWLVARLAGVVPVARIQGPETDQGELQRYLADLGRCPSALVLHPDLEFASSGDGWLRVRDVADPHRATVELRMDADGAAVEVRARRFRSEGKRFVEGPWTGRMGGFQDWQGLRMPTTLEVSWHLPDGEFTYFRAEASPVRVER